MEMSSSKKHWGINAFRFSSISWKNRQSSHIFQSKRRNPVTYPFYRIFLVIRRAVFSQKSVFLSKIIAKFGVHLIGEYFPATNSKDLVFQYNYAINRNTVGR